MKPGQVTDVGPRERSSSRRRGEAGGGLAETLFAITRGYPSLTHGLSRLVDYAYLPLWHIDRVATLARHVQDELHDNGDEESAVMYNLAVAAEAMCWHPGELEAVEQYVAAQEERLALLRRSTPDRPESG